MQTSPWSTGVTRCWGSSTYFWSTDDSAGDWYGSNSPASIALPRNVLSIPNSTSPCGRFLVRIAVLTTLPVSPFLSTLTVMPVFFVKSASVFLDSANESYVTSVTVFDVTAVDDADGVAADDVSASLPQPANARARADAVTTAPSE